MKVSCSRAAFYIGEYIKEYRRQYSRMIENGFPNIVDSPYLNANEINCYISKDGVVIADYSNPPTYNWEIAGGPAMMVDFEPSRVPQSVISILKKNGIYGKAIGIYRIVSKEELPIRIWTGKIPESIDTHSSEVDGTRVNVYQYKISWLKLIDTLSFGAFPSVLDLKFRDKDSQFWNPIIIRRLGFIPADRNNKRFFNYLELLRHVELAAWDTRSIKVRVVHDIRRDFAIHVGSKEGGTLTLSYEEQLTPFIDKLSILKNTISKFEDLLKSENDGDEEIFHKFLKENPILLDIYGKALSKPKLRYPSLEDSPLDKEYVEPDFIVKYPFNQYRLIELERPNKRIATKSGQPRSEVTQTTFQIAEWKAYIKNHYELIKDEYPSINFNCTSTVVIGRNTEESFGTGRDIKKYKEYLKEQFSVTEILTYDDLVDKAKSAYKQLSSLI